MKLGIIVDTPVEALIAARVVAPKIGATEIVFFNPTEHSLLAMSELLAGFKVRVTYTPDCKTIAEAVRDSKCDHLHLSRSAALASAARSVAKLDAEHVSFVKDQPNLVELINERDYVLSSLTDPVVSVEDIIRIADFPIINRKPNTLVSTVEQAITAACQTNTVRIADDVIVWVTENRLFAVAIDRNANSATQAIRRFTDLQAKMQQIAGRFATVGVVCPKAPDAQGLTATIQSFPESEYGKVWNQSNMERWAEDDFRSITAWVRDAIERPKLVRLPEWKSWNFNG